MRNTLFIVIICMSIFAGSIDARSRNPRPQDFNEASDFINQVTLGWHSGINTIFYEGRYGCSVGQRITVENEIFISYSCMYPFGLHTQKAYLNELDFIHIYLDGNFVVIPCLASRECNFGQPLFDRFPDPSRSNRKSIKIYTDSPYAVQKLAELLKAN